jgi:hypothetical protein
VGEGFAERGRAVAGGDDDTGRRRVQCVAAIKMASVASTLDTAQ